jgi:hypothetical protein
MDLQLVLRVLWRFRLIVACGVGLAMLLAVMSYARIGFDGGKPTLTPRESEKWESLSTLFVTSRGFPWGSIGANDPRDERQLAKRGDTGETPKTLDPVHLTGLASLYIRLATSDPILAEMKKTGPVDGKLAAYPVYSDDGGDGAVLPMVTTSAIAASPGGAKSLAERHVTAFLDYLDREQRRGAIPADERVKVQVVRQPSEATLLEARKKTRPVVVFTAVMIAIIGLVLALENLRPRGMRVVQPPEPLATPKVAEARRRPASKRRTA